MIFGIGYGFRFNCLFRFLKSLRKYTRFDLGLGWAKDGDTHYESFANLRTPSITKRSTSFLNIYSCTFGTGYGLNQIGFTSSFNPKSTGSFFQVTSVPSKILRIYVIFLEVNYAVSLLNVDTYFPQPYVNLLFRI